MASLFPSEARGASWDPMDGSDHRGVAYFFTLIDTRESLPPQMSRSGLLFSWHLHGGPWGLKDEDQETARRLARARGFRTLVPGATSLKVVPIVPGELINVVGYLNKSPRHQASLAPRAEGGMKLYERFATGANLARFHRHLTNLHLDDMAVAGEEGTELLKAIKNEALRVSLAR